LALIRDGTPGDCSRQGWRPRAEQGVVDQGSGQEPSRSEASISVHIVRVMIVMKRNRLVNRCSLVQNWIRCKTCTVYGTLQPGSPGGDFLVRHCRERSALRSSMWLSHSWSLSSSSFHPPERRPRLSRSARFPRLGPGAWRASAAASRCTYRALLLLGKAIALLLAKMQASEERPGSLKRNLQVPPHDFP